MALKTNDIIEIVTHEGGRLNVRRVQVTRVRKQEPHCACGDPHCPGSKGSYAVKASNLKGKYERSYTLPLEPIAVARNPEFQDCVNWIVPDDLDGQADP